MKKFLGIVGILILVGFTGFCGKSREERQAERAVKQLKNQMEKMAKGMKEMAEQTQQKAKEVKEVKVMDFKALEEALPEVEGWKRANLEGQKMAASGLSYSTASAEYTRDGIKVHVSITDTAGAKVALMPVLGMVNMGIEREDEHGYQKIVKKDGLVGVEEYDKDNQEGNLSLVYKNRYVITLQGSNLKSPSDLKLLWDLLEKIDLSKLN